MNGTSSLESYLTLGVYLLFIVFATFIVAKFVLKFRKNKKLIKSQSVGIQRAQEDLKKWQVLPELLKRTAYSNDLEQSLDLVASYLAKALDVSSISYILKTPRGYTFRAWLCGTVSKSYLLKSKDALTKAYMELANVKDQTLLSDEHVNGGDVIASEDFKTGQGVSDYLKQVFVPINYTGELVGALGVFGSADILDSSDTASFITKAVDMCAFYVEEYKNALARERGKIESILQSMGEGVLLFDHNYKVSVINKTATVFLACQDNRPSGISEVSSLIKGALPIQEVVSGVMDSGEEKSFKRIYVNERYLGFTFMPVTFNRETVGVGVIMHNDSEEEQLKNLREDFTAMVVHELRAPLTVIRGSADMILQNKGKFTQQDIDLFLNQIKSSSWDLLRLVSDLLDSAKIDSGKFTVNKSLHSLNQILQQEVEKYKAFTESKNIDLILDLSEDISDIPVDEEKIVQVLNNLMSNAVKFTYKGEITHMGERGFVKIGSRVQGGFVQVFVADNGRGISNEVKKQLFNKFVQARESQVSNESGTGLGLVISKGIVEAHGGKIWVEDNVPKGSVFIFTLPTS